MAGERTEREGDIEEGVPRERAAAGGGPAAPAADGEAASAPPAGEGEVAPAAAAVKTALPAEPLAAVDLAAEPDYPPPTSVPRPPPPTALKVYPAPVVDEITPARGPVFVETRLRLLGANLLRVSIVRIGGLIAQTVGVDEPRELRVLSPPAAKPGDVDITVENPFLPPVVLPQAFRYEALAAPEIVSVAPDHVATQRRTELTVTGKNFVKGTVVLFNGKPVESARFVSSTAIDVTAPPGEHGKLVDVSVKNPDGATATARRAFVHDGRFG